MYYLTKAKDFVALDIRIAKTFGLKAAYYDFMKNFIFRRNEGIGKKIYYNKYENIKTILLEKYLDSINKYKVYNKEYNNGLIEPDSNIWIFWWQGMDKDTPELVKKCIESVERHKNKHNVIVITKNNIKNYVDLPDYYYKKLNENKITLTHFSDILRIELLYKYGGIWTDASLYWIKPLPKEIYDMKFFTIKHGLLADFHVCKGLWTDGFLVTGKNNPMFLYLREMFQKYWSETDFLICYLLIDCFIALGYENLDFFKNMVDLVPFNNSRMYFIDQKGNEAFDEGDYETHTKDTYIYRIHYKKKFNHNTHKGMLTNFGHMMTQR